MYLYLVKGKQKVFFDWYDYIDVVLSRKDHRIKSRNRQKLLVWFK